jgi:hypothetical protein
MDQSSKSQMELGIVDDSVFWYILNLPVIALTFAF